MMAIYNRKQLNHTQKKIAELEPALEAMKRKEFPTSYTIMSKGFIPQIEQMRQGINEYLGISQEKLEEHETVKK